jgi:hypothetical protein
MITFSRAAERHATNNIETTLKKPKMKRIFHRIALQS